MIKNQTIIVTALLVILLNISQSRELIAQPNFSSSIQVTTSKAEALPFWIRSNFMGIYPHSRDIDNVTAIAQLRYGRVHSSRSGDLHISYGAAGNYSYSKESNFQLDSYFIALQYCWFALDLGKKPEPIANFNLSSTNMNMLWSNNSQAIPGVILKSNGFIPIIKSYPNLTVMAEYGEGFLRGDRYVDSPMLHRKKAHAKWSSSSREWEITLGLDDYAQWGGVSPEHGDLTTNFVGYIRTVLGLSAPSGSPEGEQINAAGNHVSQYVIMAERSSVNSDIIFYKNHIFEDASGREWENWEDGLWGLSLTLKRGSAIKGIVYEFTNTKDQSGPTHLAPTPENPDNKTGRGKDSYFSHYIYKSGWTNHGYTMGTPFMTPAMDEDGVVTGFPSTRLASHYIGMRGDIGRDLNYQTKLSFTEYFGNHGTPNYTKQFSYLIGVGYAPQRTGWYLSGRLAGDIGDQFTKSTALELSASYSF